MLHEQNCGVTVLTTVTCTALSRAFCTNLISRVLGSSHGMERCSVLSPADNTSVPWVRKRLALCCRQFITPPNLLQCNSTTAAMAYLQVLAVGSVEESRRPCVDCAQVTDCYCDYCYAIDRAPREHWVDNQHTPLCSACDRKHDMCHFCRGCDWAQPKPWH